MFSAMEPISVHRVECLTLLQAEGRSSPYQFNVMKGFMNFTYQTLLLALGLGFVVLVEWDRSMRHHIGFTPEQWKMASNPLVQGLAFQLNIPAFAPAILCGLMGAATVSGSPVTGYKMIAVFAFALTLPLLPLSIAPNLARPLDRLADWLRSHRWFLGMIFVGIGIRSAWFGLFVDPVDWSRT